MVKSANYQEWLTQNELMPQIEAIKNPCKLIIYKDFVLLAEEAGFEPAVGY